MAKAHSAMRGGPLKKTGERASNPSATEKPAGAPPGTQDALCGPWQDFVVMKEDQGSRVVAVSDWVIKENGPRKGRGMLRFGLRRSGARRAFVLAHMLLEHGIPTPEPMAWATCRRLRLRIRDCLITRRISDVEDLKSRCMRVTASKADRAHTLESLGRLMASFHANGFSNRDMKDANILCSLSGPLKMWVVDLDGVRRWRSVSRNRARRDVWPIARSLGRVGWVTASDIKAFLAGYNATVPERLKLDRLPYLEPRG